MSHQPSNHNNDDKFVPGSDNNANLNWIKIVPMMLGLAAIIVACLGIVKWVGYLQNEQQVEWRIQHERPFRDSHQNWELIKNISEEKKEQMEGKATVMGEKPEGTEREESMGDDKKNDKKIKEEEKEKMNEKEQGKDKENVKPEGKEKMNQKGKEEKKDKGNKEKKGY
jgi:hypothetical protein